MNFWGEVLVVKLIRAAVAPPPSPVMNFWAGVKARW